LLIIAVNALPRRSRSDRSWTWLPRSPGDLVGEFCGLAQVLDHGVDPAHDLGNLVVALDLDQMVEIAFRNGADGGVDLGEAA
jgi:hypothetical protein